MSKTSADKGITTRSTLNDYWDYTSTTLSSTLADTSSYVSLQYNSAAAYMSSQYPSPWITKYDDGESSDLLSPLNNNQNGNLPFLLQVVQNRNGIGSRHMHKYHALQSPSDLKRSLKIRSLDCLGTKEMVTYPDYSKLITGSSSFENTDNIDLSGSMGDESLRGASKSTPRYNPSESAAHLAEGTIRMLRDIELDEAIQLHRSLAFWTNRLERPYLSWLEAGPWVWFSEEGFNHASIAEKISQIQAVLARRVAAIGDLQQHLLRAAWQKGVASWIVLGGAGEWAAVAGFDGEMKTETFDEETILTKDKTTPEEGGNQINLDRQQQLLAFEFGTIESALVQSPPIGLRRSGSLKPRKSMEVAAEEKEDNTSHQYYGNADVVVDAKHGGKIKTNETALAEWSVDAIKLVRGQLFRAGHGDFPLPYADNWIEDAGDVASREGQVVVSEPDDDGSKRSLPKWASYQLAESSDDFETSKRNSIFRSQTDYKGCIEITDLPLMAGEVSELLNSIETIMDYQKDRGLRRLQATPRRRRNWYLYASGVPVVTYLLIKLLKNKELLHFLIGKIKMFYQEHLWDPIKSIFGELFSRKERESISDHEARSEVIDSLKKMIRSWLDETFPLMGEQEKTSRAERMDISLVEQVKEENMKTIYEINSVVRMSFIEMQFIKKEMMNALHAIDQMMTSNEINMNLAAVTPAVLLLYSVRSLFRFLYYALLKLGKSREETHAEFRKIMLDVERLLVMRDCPPSAPPPMCMNEKDESLDVNTIDHNDVLSADDLGMLMLHIHSCRNMLWKERRRFTEQAVREVAEDLAELAGERGPVSVRQQLQILGRMYRTHAFMKVVSTGIPFDNLIGGPDV